MLKLSKNYIIVITLSVISLILGGTFFAISQNKARQSVASNSNSNLTTSNSVNLNSNSAISENQSLYFFSSLGATEKWYFKGNIDKKPIRMVLNYSCISMPICHEQVITGNYIYENVSKNKLQLNCTFLGAGIAKFECQETEIIDSDNLGQTSKTTGIWSRKTAPSNADKITGTWSNPDKTKTLPFSLEKTEEFNLENFLVKKESLTDLKKDNISIEDRKLWYQKLKWSRECEDNSSDFEILGDRSGQMEFLNLSNTELLVDINCNCGAYQCWHNLVYYDEKNDVSKLLEFDSYNDDGNKIKKNLLTLPSFDPKAKTIETLNKYTGHGGCGYAGDYKWNNSLKKFELTEFRQNTDCNDINKMKNWKVIYQK